MHGQVWDDGGYDAYRNDEPLAHAGGSSALDGSSSSWDEAMVHRCLPPEEGSWVPLGAMHQKGSQKGLPMSEMRARGHSGLLPWSSTLVRVEDNLCLPLTREPWEVTDLIWRPRGRKVEEAASDHSIILPTFQPAEDRLQPPLPPPLPLPVPPPATINKKSALRLWSKLDSLTDASLLEAMGGQGGEGSKGQLQAPLPSLSSQSLLTSLSQAFNKPIGQKAAHTESHANISQANTTILSREQKSTLSLLAADPSPSELQSWVEWRNGLLPLNNPYHRPFDSERFALWREEQKKHLNTRKNENPLPSEPPPPPSCSHKEDDPMELDVNPPPPPPSPPSTISSHPPPPQYVALLRLRIVTELLGPSSHAGKQLLKSLLGEALDQSLPRLVSNHEAKIREEERVRREAAERVEEEKRLAELAAEEERLRLEAEERERMMKERAVEEEKRRVEAEQEAEIQRLLAEQKAKKDEEERERKALIKKQQEEERELRRKQQEEIKKQEEEERELRRKQQEEEKELKRKKKEEEALEKKMKKIAKEAAPPASATGSEDVEAVDGEGKKGLQGKGSGAMGAKGAAGPSSALKAKKRRRGSDDEDENESDLEEEEDEDLPLQKKAAPSSAGAKKSSSKKPPPPSRLHPLTLLIPSTISDPSPLGSLRDHPISSRVHYIMQELIDDLRRKDHEWSSKEKLDDLSFEDRPFGGDDEAFKSYCEDVKEPMWIKKMEGDLKESMARTREDEERGKMSPEGAPSEVKGESATAAAATCVYPPTKEGFADLCRHAKLLGSNCVDYNEGDKEWVKLGRWMGKMVVDVIKYRQTQINNLGLS